MITHKKNTFAYLLPLLVIELYLLLTLIFLKFGPITWRLHNNFLFWYFICMYHITFILGYLYVVYKHRNNVINHYNSTIKFENFILKHFWKIWFLALIASLIMYKNGVNNATIIPYNIFEKIHTGLVSFSYARGLVTMSYTNEPHNTVSITLFYAITAVFRYSLLPIVIFFWNQLSIYQKFFGILIALFPVTISISSGTNSYTILICLTIFMSACILILRKFYLMEKIKNFKLIVFSLALLIVSCFAIFITVMSSRIPTESLYSLENASSLGDVSFSDSIESSTLTASLAKIDYYLVQGYYGMSLALSEDFTPTYGIGSSLFLVSFFDKHFKTDINKNTYQYKISPYWNEYAQWHSFYSQVANDVSFIGMIFFMFILGQVFSRIYISCLIHNNIFAKLLFPLFGIMFLFLPMNNQVFNNMELMISFWILLLLWVKTRFKL